MKKNVLRFGVLFLLLTTISTSLFAQKFENAIDLNNHLSDINAGLYSLGQEWGKRMGAISASSKKYDSLAPVRRKLEVYIENKKAELVQMKDQFGSKEFREAMIGFLDYEKVLIIKAFLPLEQLNPSSTKEEVDKSMENLVTLAEQETAYLSKITTAQLAFAKANNFTIAEE